MEWVEIAGKSVEDARERALEELGVDLSDAEIEVVAEEKLGLFGRVKTEARVRARVRPAAPRAKEDSSRRRRRPAKDDAAVSDSDSEERTSKNDAEASRAERPPRRRKDGRRPRPEKNDESAAQGDNMEDVPLSDQSVVAREFLEGLLATTGASVTIETRVDEEEELVFLDVQGDSLGHLIGPRGATLHAVQDLTRTVVQRKTGARNGRILVDISSYREKRKQALERFTRQVAQEVVDSGEGRSLEPMSAPDRKIVHDTINSIDGVSTTSEGEEPRRRVVIQPAD